MRIANSAGDRDCVHGSGGDRVMLMMTVAFLRQLVVLFVFLQSVLNTRVLLCLSVSAGDRDCVHGSGGDRAMLMMTVAFLRQLVVLFVFLQSVLNTRVLL